MLARIGRRHLRILEHRLQAGGVVDAGQALHVRIGHQHVGVAAALGAAVVVADAGVGHVVRMAIGVDQRAHDVALAVGCDQGQQRAVAAKGVPDRLEVVVIRLIRRPLRILAAVVGGHQHGVVQRGVELAPLDLVGAMDLDPRQRLVPLRHRRLMHGREAPAGDFPFGIPTRLREADEGDADLHLDRLAGLDPVVQRGTEILVGIGVRVAGGIEPAATPGLRTGRGRVGQQVEIHPVFATLVPAAGVAAHAFDLVVGQHVDVAAEEALVFLAGAHVERMLDVHRDMRIAGVGEGVALQAGAPAGGQFGPGPVAAQVGRVIADTGRLVAARRMDIGRLQRSGDRGHQDVAVLPRAPAQVQMAEAHHLARAVIAGLDQLAVVRAYVRAELDHAERHRGAEEHLAIPVHADERIDVLRVLGGRHRGGDGEQTSAGEPGTPMGRTAGTAAGEPFHLG